MISAQEATPLSAVNIDPSDLQHLAEHGFVVVEDFLPTELYEDLREDVKALRSLSKFKLAKIGHDGMVQDENTPFRDVRHSETCFIGRLADDQLPQTNKARKQLYDVLDTLRSTLETNAIVKQGRETKSIPPLDRETEELMYAYYPQGGYYRRHRDAEPGSVSNWRKYSLLLYLNDKDWRSHHGGQLRIHRDSGGDELPPGELPNYIDIQPKAGTLVLFRSDRCPHEVIDTHRERVAVVGWFLSQEPNDPESENTNPSSTASSTSIHPDALAALRALRDANPRLKAKLEPPPTPANPPSALSIWGDDYILPGAIATPSRAPAQEQIFPDSDERYWKKIATFDTEGRVNTLSLSTTRLAQVRDIIPQLLDHVVTLDLANTVLPTADLSSILGSINAEQSKLQTLRLGGNCLDHEHLHTILEQCDGLFPTLQCLDLRYNDLGPRGAEILAKALLKQKDSCCKVLYLEGTKLGDEGAAALAEVKSLEEVYLGSNHIGPQGAARLAETATRSWRKLFLEGNNIGDEGAEAFIAAITSANLDSQKTLVRLYADNNGMSKETNIRLGNAVGSATLIGDGGIFQ